MQIGVLAQIIFLAHLRDILKLVTRAFIVFILFYLVWALFLSFFFVSLSLLHFFSVGLSDSKWMALRFMPPRHQHQQYRCGKLQPPVISFADVAFSYSGKKEDYLFSKLHFGIDSDSRIALVGPNGAGKSTLLKVRVSSFFAHLWISTSTVFLCSIF